VCRRKLRRLIASRSLQDDNAGAAFVQFGDERVLSNALSHRRSHSGAAGLKALQQTLDATLPEKVFTEDIMAMGRSIQSINSVHFKLRKTE
jgi:hypothetical protein